MLFFAWVIMPIDVITRLILGTLDLSYTQLMQGFQANVVLAGGTLLLLGIILLIVRNEFSRKKRK